MTENEISKVVVEAGRTVALAGLKLRSLVLIPELATMPASGTHILLCALASWRLCVENSCHVCAELHGYRLMISRILEAYRLWSRRRKYRVGVVISRFIACDVRRDIEIVDASEVDEGYLTVRWRTWNVLHVSKGIGVMPELSRPIRVETDRIWDWSGRIR
jgi:hypothetical protein